MPAIKILMRDKTICHTTWQKFELISGFDVHGQGIPSKVSIHQYAQDIHVAPHISLEMHDPTLEDMRVNMTLKSSFHPALEINIIPHTRGVARGNEFYREGGMHHEWHYCQCIETEYSLLDTVWEVHDAINCKLLFTIGINHYGRDRVLTSSRKLTNAAKMKGTIKKTTEGNLKKIIKKHAPLTRSKAARVEK